MTSISLPGASGRCFVRSVFTCWACVAVANPKVKINTERMSFFRLCIASDLSVMCCDIRWRGPKIKRDLLATPFQYLFLVYCSVEKLMHQRPNLIHFFFQREMARVEKMELRRFLTLLPGDLSCRPRPIGTTIRPSRKSAASRS